MHEQLKIESGMITTVHNITGTQSLVDMPNAKKKDLRCDTRSHMHTLAQTCIGPCMGPCMHARAGGACVYALCKHTCMHAHMHASMRKPMRACIYVCMHAGVHVCMHAGVRVCIHSYTYPYRRSRSGMLNLAPTTTGSATAVAEVFYPIPIEHSIWNFP